jgi:hypothetical protein
MMHDQKQETGLDEIKKRSIVVKPKGGIYDDPVNRLRGMNIVNVLQERGWNIILDDSCPKADIVLYLDSLHIDRSVSSQYTLLDIQDNHLTQENPASLFMNRMLNKGLTIRIKYLLKHSKLTAFAYRWWRRKKDRKYLVDIQSADALICSSFSLKKEYQKFNEKTYYIPDSVETYVSPEKKFGNQEKVSICWIGTKNNIAYLTLIAEAIQMLQSKYPVEFTIISSEAVYSEAALAEVLKSLPFEYTFVKWEKDSVTPEIAKHMIAVAPLPEGAQKSTNKILTYMAAGVATVCSGASDYAMLHQDNQKSFIFLDNNSQKGWYEALVHLIEDETFRKKLAHKGYLLSREYALDRVVAQYEALFYDILKGKEDV